VTFDGTDGQHALSDILIECIPSFYQVTFSQVRLFKRPQVLHCQFYIAPSGQQLTSHADMVKWLSTTEQNHYDIKKYLPLVFKVPDTSFHPVILTLRNMTISSYKRQKNVQTMIV